MSDNYEQKPVDLELVEPFLDTAYSCSKMKRNALVEVKGALNS